jgi:hypothetical protein
MPDHSLIGLNEHTTYIQREVTHLCFKKYFWANAFISLFHTQHCPIFPNNRIPWWDVNRVFRSWDGCNVRCATPTIYYASLNPRAIARSCFSSQHSMGVVGLFARLVAGVKRFPSFFPRQKWACQIFPPTDWACFLASKQVPAQSHPFDWVSGELERLTWFDDSSQVVGLQYCGVNKCSNKCTILLSICKSWKVNVWFCPKEKWNYKMKFHINFM